MPARILMVTPRFPPHRGGVESHVYEVARRLARDPSFEVEVLTTDLEGSLAPREVVEGISVRRVRAWPRRGDLYYAPEIYRRVVRSEADLIHCQGYHTLVAPLAMLAARRAGLPYLVTLHSGGHSSRLRNAVRPIQARILSPLLTRAQMLIAVSEFEARLFERLLGLAPSRISVIPNGADMPTAAPSDPIDRDPHLILSVGRLERYKGHHRLIEALPAVRSLHPEARLQIAGSGPYERQLRALAERLGVADVVEIRGMPREELHGLLQRAAVVALLSDYESQGIAIYEALALGCRVLVLQASALAELATLPTVRAVSPDADPAQVARALVEQMAASDLEPEERPSLPTWDECAANTRGIYLETLSKRDTMSQRKNARSR